MGSWWARFALQFFANVFGWDRVARWLGVVPPPLGAAPAARAASVWKQLAAGNLPEPGKSPLADPRQPFKVIGVGRLFQIFLSSSLSAVLGRKPNRPVRASAHARSLAPVPHTPSEQTHSETATAVETNGTTGTTSPAEPAPEPSATTENLQDTARGTARGEVATGQVISLEQPSGPLAKSERHSGLNVDIDALERLVAAETGAAQNPRATPEQLSRRLYSDGRGHEHVAFSQRPHSHLAPHEQIERPKQKPQRQSAADRPAFEVVQPAWFARRRLVSNQQLGGAFWLFIAVTVTLFLRPAEIFPLLDGLPIYEVLICLTLLASGEKLLGHLQSKALLRQPVSVCVTGMLAAIVVSHLTHFYLGGVVDSGIAFAKTLVYYCLLLATVTTITRLKVFLRWVALCGAVMVTLCVVDYHELIDFHFVEHLSDTDDVDDEGTVLSVLRMRGTGIFHDPNDLAMVIVATAVLCTYFLTDRAAGFSRFLWLVPLVVLAIGLLDTKSRGGLVASGAAGMVLLTHWYGRTIGIALAGLASLALPILSGRASGLGLDEEGTGSERVEIWREGFDALKSPDLLFGIGHGFYADLAGLVAHNSFIHAYVELGVIGGTCFFGAFFLAAWQVFRAGRGTEVVLHPELLRMRPYVLAMLLGWCGSMFSLSRCYVVPTYMVLGIAATFANVVRLYSPTGKPLLTWNFSLGTRLTAASACAFAGLYLLTAVLLR